MKARPLPVKKSKGATSSSTRTPVLPYGLDSSSLAPPSLQTEAAKIQKMQAFSLGRQKKSPFQRHQEEKMLRKKKADEETARAYAEFVSSFEDQKPDGGKTFIRGEVLEYSEDGKLEKESEPHIKAEEQEVDEKSESKGSTYVLSMPLKPDIRPKRIPQPLSIFSGVESQMEKALPKKSDRKRDIDDLKEELAREQAARERRSRRHHSSSSSGDAGSAVAQNMELDDSLLASLGSGSYDANDPSSTNIHIANLAPSVNEDILFEEFKRFGPVGSVKVMWPRSDVERARNRNSGFVAFMNRRSAEEAAEEMQGVHLQGYEMRISWGKCVPLPPAPLVKPGVFAVLPVQAGIAVAPGPFGIPPASAMLPPGQIPPGAVKATVSIPEDERLAALICRMARYVVQHGHPFEQLIMDREKGNCDFAFLFQVSSLEHTFYRWRVYAYLQGDKDNSWRVAPFQMCVGGPWLVPPPLPLPKEKSKRDRDRDRRGERRRGLSNSEHDEFEDMLRSLTVERSKICDAMVFCLDHAESAAELVETIVESLTLVETPVPTKIARLFLVSDVLHNSGASSVHNAFAFRSHFESSLPSVFSHMALVLKSITGRVTALRLKEQVLRVLHVWNRWSLYEPSFLEALQSAFLSATSSGVIQAASEVSTVLPVGEEPELDGVPLSEKEERILAGSAAVEESVRVSLPSSQDARKEIFSGDSSVPVDRDVIPDASSTLTEQERLHLREMEVKVLEFKDRLEKQGVDVVSAELQAQQFRSRLTENRQNNKRKNGMHSSPSISKRRRSSSSRSRSPSPSRSRSRTRSSSPRHRRRHHRRTRQSRSRSRSRSPLRGYHSDRSGSGDGDRRHSHSSRRHDNIV